MHLLDHFRPRPRLYTRRFAKAHRAKTAIANKTIVWFDLNRKFVSLLDERKKVKLADRLAGRVPNTVQLRMVDDYFCN